MKPRKLMGFESPSDQKIPVAVRDWNATKLALWRSKSTLAIIARAAAEVVDRCTHVDGCRAKNDESEPCSEDRYTILSDGSGKAVLTSKGCPDRELRMSMLVILGAARAFSPINARAPVSEPYMAPSREYYSEVWAELMTAQAQLEAALEALRAAGIEEPSPPPNHQLQESTT